MSRASDQPNAYIRKAVLYRNRARQLAEIADDGHHDLTSDQLHQLSDDNHRLAHQMGELHLMEKLIRRR